MAITIWNVHIYDKDTNQGLLDYYFLTYKKAKKFVEKHKQEWEAENCIAGIGGEPLVL